MNNLHIMYMSMYILSYVQCVYACADVFMWVGGCSILKNNYNLNQFILFIIFSRTFGNKQIRLLKNNTFPSNLLIGIHVKQYVKWTGIIISWMSILIRGLMNSGSCKFFAYLQN